jgi:hypothetical protein
MGGPQSWCGCSHKEKMMMMMMMIKIAVIIITIVKYEPCQYSERDENH